MSADGVTPSRGTRAVATYLLLWLPALIVAAFVSFVALITFRSEPMLSAISFLLALPAVLLGAKSFRASAIAMAGLLVWDVVSTTWPHIALSGFITSTIDLLLLVVTVLTALVWAASPFRSLADFVRQLRERRSQIGGA